ncbi:universal stress protein UspE [Parashewanella spongiae]|uniref:Universal stress protein UspE n=1 Tax=Parashewanella spongiae TaxID=342950 RepID=A0A3A6TZX6_9GAMM|nr:universal stress protein UspE [Parashewanella spongiae]MCL1077258.1 universal stress protein UspE [Parashewanella spongiae]RJY18558.1 universal stress protein UspE [Parashewanella spongiae]
MTDYKKLLVVIAPSTDHQIALDRAVALSQKNDSPITVFLTIFDFSYEMTSILSADEREGMRQGVIQQRKAWLDSILEPYLSEGIDINSVVVWHNRPFESIIQHAIKGDYDVIIKGTHEHDKLKSVIFTPTDWHLMRKAPFPVLLVKDHAWPVNGKIVCAVNVSDDNEHQAINTKIIAHAKQLANQFEAEVHLVNAYPGTPVNISIELPSFDAFSYNESVRIEHENQLIKMAELHGINQVNCHAKEGLPEDVIPEVAQELDSELVILGTVGRTGISAALIGNTAEHVIDNINCDLLALKPDGYISPVTT